MNRAGPRQWLDHRGRSVKSLGTSTRLIFWQAKPSNWNDLKFAQTNSQMIWNIFFRKHWCTKCPAHGTYQVLPKLMFHKVTVCLCFHLHCSHSRRLWTTCSLYQQQGWTLALGCPLFVFIPQVKNCQILGTSVCRSPSFLGRSFTSIFYGPFTLWVGLYLVSQFFVSQLAHFDNFLKEHGNQPFSLPGFSSENTRQTRTFSELFRDLRWKDKLKRNLFGTFGTFWVFTALWSILVVITRMFFAFCTFCS